MKLLFRLLINALGLLLITRLLEGFQVDSFYYALIAAIVIGLLNALVRPVLFILTLPITIVTLGLFVFVINALMIWFAASFLEGFAVDGFMTALVAAALMWLIGMLTNWFIRDSKDEAK